jgi:hypothetical protein
MNRIIKIVVLAALAALATAAVASANVAVTDGVGFVGKGDVQTALGYDNDAAIQADAKNITFTQVGDTMTTIVTGTKCAPVTDNGGLDSSKVHVLDPFVAGNFGTTTTTYNAVARANGQGKITNGWDLSGIKSTTTTPDSTDYNVGHYCPAGEHFAGWVDAAHVFSNGVIPGGGLMVSGNAKTVALPNTPVL